MGSSKTARFVTVSAVCISATAWAGPPENAEQAVKDAWLDGRLESAYALNSELSAFDISTDVENGVVRLRGTVESDISRELAVEIAKGIDGVSDIEDALQVTGVNAEVRREEDGASRSFGQWVEDVTATARVKSNLVGNGNTRDLAIEVETENDVVTLKGSVPSRKEKMLAEMIARNTDGIANVRNRIQINTPS